MPPNDQEPRYRLVDANGNVVGSLFLNGNGDVAIQDESGTETAFTTDGISTPAVDADSVSTDDVTSNTNTDLEFQPSEDQSNLNEPLVGGTDRGSHGLGFGGKLVTADGSETVLKTVNNDFLLVSYRKQNGGQGSDLLHCSPESVSVINSEGIASFPTRDYACSEFDLSTSIADSNALYNFVITSLRIFPSTNY